MTRLQAYKVRPDSRLLSLKRRCYGLAAIDRVKLINLKKLIAITHEKLLSVDIDVEEMYDDLISVIINLISKQKSILAVPDGLITPLPKVLSKNVTIDCLVENDILQNLIQQMDF